MPMATCAYDITPHCAVPSHPHIIHTSWLGSKGLTVCWLISISPLNNHNQLVLITQVRKSSLPIYSIFNQVCMCVCVCNIPATWRVSCDLKVEKARRGVQERGEGEKSRGRREKERDGEWYYNHNNYWTVYT